MRFIVNLGEMLEIKVRVNLRCGNVGVAQQLLDPAQVVAGLEDVGGEGVAEEMRVDIGVDALAPGPVFDARLH